jgi:hypothetical protein
MSKNTTNKTKAVRIPDRGNIPKPDVINVSARQIATQIVIGRICVFVAPSVFDPYRSTSLVCIGIFQLTIQTAYAKQGLLLSKLKTDIVGSVLSRQENMTERR